MYADVSLQELDWVLTDYFEVSSNACRIKRRKDVNLILSTLPEINANKFDFFVAQFLFDTIVYNCRRW